MDLNTRVLDEKINLLKKSLEIVGGTSYLNGKIQIMIHYFN